MGDEWDGIDDAALVAAADAAEARMPIPQAMRRRRKHLIFDTEYEHTHGRPVGEKWRNDIILQLAWVVFDADDDSDTGNYSNYYVLRPELPTNYHHRITGITRREHLDKLGVDLPTVMRAFMNDVRTCDMLVAFNYMADYHHVLNELLRLPGSANEVDSFKNATSLCLMHATRNVVNALDANGNPKMPKLAELYAHFFKGATFPNAHDARADVAATLACYRVYRGSNAINIQVKK
jgi:hypothetical protein